MASDAQGQLEEAKAAVAAHLAGGRHAKAKAARERCVKLGERVGRCRARAREASALREEQCRDLCEAVALLLRASAHKVRQRFLVPLAVLTPPVPSAALWRVGFRVGEWWRH
jgi:hypothetical protein